MPRKKRQKTVDREALFVAEYLVDLNGTEACRRAGYEGTRATLCQQAYVLLRKPEVLGLVRKGMEKRSARVEVLQDEVLQVLLDHLRADISEAFDDDGQLLDLDKMPPHVRRQIQSIEVEELYEGHGRERVNVGRMHKLKLWSKDKALELALRHKGLLNDKLLVKEELSLEELVNAAMASRNDDGAWSSSRTPSSKEKSRPACWPKRCASASRRPASRARSEAPEVVPPALHPGGGERGPVRDDGDGDAHLARVAQHLRAHRHQRHPGRLAG
jgi:phage terminase small subunit